MKTIYYDLTFAGTILQTSAPFQGMGVIRAKQGFPKSGLTELMVNSNPLDYGRVSWFEGDIESALESWMRLMREYNSTLVFNFEPMEEQQMTPVEYEIARLDKPETDYLGEGDTPSRLIERANIIYRSILDDHGLESPISPSDLEAFEQRLLAKHNWKTGRFQSALKYCVDDGRLESQAPSYIVSHP